MLHMSGVIGQMITGAMNLGISMSAFAGPHPEVRVQRSVLDCELMLKADTLRCMHCKTTRIASCQQYHDCNEIIAVYDVMKNF